MGISCKVSGGMAPYVWSVVNGPLPKGVRIDVSPDTSMASLAGTPEVAGCYDFAIRAADSMKPLPGSFNKQMHVEKEAARKKAGHDRAHSVNDATCKRGLLVEDGLAVGASAKTLLQVTAKGTPVRIVEFHISCPGVLSQALLIELLTQTSDGVMTEYARPDDTYATTARHTAAVEPAAGDILRSYTVDSQIGLVVQYGDNIILSPGERLGLRVTAPTVTECNVGLVFEE